MSPIHDKKIIFFLGLALISFGTFCVFFFKVQGGGNAGNALTCASRLGLNARLISKVFHF